MHVLVCEYTYVMYEVNFLYMHFHVHGNNVILVCIWCMGHLNCQDT